MRDHGSRRLRDGRRRRGHRAGHDGAVQPQERSGLAWTPALGEETFERITGFVIATLDDVKASPRAVAEMQLLPMKAR